MDPDLPPLPQSDWFRDFEAREWAARMDDHAERRSAELFRDRWHPVVGRDGRIDLLPSPEVIQRAIWGKREVTDR